MGREKQYFKREMLEHLGETPHPARRGLSNVHRRFCLEGSLRVWSLLLPLFLFLPLSCKNKTTAATEAVFVLPSASTSASASASVSTSSGASATASSAAYVGKTSLDVVFAGDAIPQVKVLANKVEDIFSNIPAWWGQADGRVINLEAPIGARDGLPGDKTLLAYAAPPSWFQDLFVVSKASAFVVANNHACDLGPDGLANTVREAGAISAPIIGADATDPWKAVVVAQKDGRKVCVVAWTTFLNDKGRKQKGCLEGASGARVSQAELGPKGLADVHAALSAEGRFAGCDGRVAYIHGGREYRAQIRPLLDQASVAAAYVDAVIISHPHVPDGIENVAAATPKTPESAGGRTLGRAVPVYKTLGNFISNQGIAWTVGMSVSLLDRGGVPDPIRTVWTRVAVVARLRFLWESTPAGPSTAPPSTLKYGYSLLFMDRILPIAMKLRAIPSGTDDHVAEKLAKGPKPFGGLLTDRCRLGAEGDPVCEPTLTGKPAPESKGSPEE